MAEVRWTHETLARAVNAIAAEADVHLNYDRSAVARWLAGSQPRGETPVFVAEAFARQLGRVVEVPELGFAHRSGGESVGAHESGDIVADLADTASEDLAAVRDGRKLKDIYRLVDAAAAPWPALDRHTRQLSPLVQNGCRCGGPEAITAVAESYSCVDRMFGGAHARLSLVTYLATDVVARLRRSRSGEPHPDLYAAAAACVGRAGFMCFDSRRHGLALRYFRLALRFAIAGNDQEIYAKVLRAMGGQAWSLGHYRAATRLAVASADSAVTVPTRAVALGQSAVAHASVGEIDVAESAIGRALDLLRRRYGGEGAHRAALADLKFYESCVLEAKRDAHGAIAALDTALRYRSEAERRARTLTSIRLVGLLLAAGQARSASLGIDQMLADHAKLCSPRVDGALVGLRARVQDPHRHHQPDCAFCELTDRVELIRSRTPDAA